MKKEKVYKILFIQLGEVYEIFAKNIYQSDMYAFLEVEEFIFGSDDQLVVDPSSEKLKNEFKKVKKSFIPIASIQRIDEVDKHGEAKIKKGLTETDVTTSLVAKNYASWCRRRPFWTHGDPVRDHFVLIFFER